MPSFMLHPQFGGYSVKYSPWGGDRIAVCASENFGVQGSGKVYILNNPMAQGAVGLEAVLPTADGVFDVAWSEQNPQHLLAAGGDGMTRLFDLSSEAPGMPKRMWQSQGETHAVDWNPVSKQLFATGSWGREVKVWNPAQDQPVMAYQEHQKEVYRVVWSPKHNELLASCSGDGTFKLWDIRRPSSVVTHNAHMGEILLSCDWNKYDPNVLATSGVDKMVRLWDVRRLQQPVVQLRGHQSAVRVVRFSPHSRNLVLSGGYDFQLCLFDTDRPQPLAQRYVQHKEFVIGCDWSLEHPGVVASAGWDGMVYVWQLGKPVVATHGSQPPLQPCPPPPKVPIIPGSGVVPS